MEPYWNLFFDTGDPLAYLLYRSEHASAAQPGTLEPKSDEKEATLWQPPPIS